jgi:phosphatidate phosphatase APP1
MSLWFSPPARLPGQWVRASIVWWSSLALAVAAPSKIKPPAQVEFYPEAASLGQNEQGEPRWRLPLHVHVYEPESRGLAVSLLRKMIGLDDDAMTAEEQRLFRERARLFMADNLSEQRVEVQIAGQTVELGPTAGNGQYLGHLILSARQLAGFITQTTNGPARVGVMAATNFTTGRVFAGQVHLIEPRGLGVISDMDDTIKDSHVLDHQELMKNTFCRPFKPVPGMAPLYQRWAAQHRCSFFYVTGSPRQLYQPLNDFLRTNNFPSGVFHLREFNFGNTTFFNLFKSPENYKIREISGIFAEFPYRKYILVGDSGEQDPEIYSTLAREHPDKILRIFIRNVTDEPADSERFQRLFKDLPAEKWRIFKDPAELQGIQLE